jgi:uncharacterized membrane protein YqhA
LWVVNSEFFDLINTHKYGDFHECNNMFREKDFREYFKTHFWLKCIFLLSRFLVVIAITTLLLTSIFVFMTGLADFVGIAQFVLNEGLLSSEIGKVISVSVIEMIDLYLIGLVLIVFTLGLYQLFIDPDLELPEWLNTSSLDTLKERLMILVMVLLPIIFLGHLSSSKDGTYIALIGIGIGVVMIAIAYLFSIITSARIEIGRIELLETADKNRDN